MSKPRGRAKGEFLEARMTAGQKRQLELSVRDSEAFAEALLNPAPANDRLRETVHRYRYATGC